MQSRSRIRFVLEPAMIGETVEVDINDELAAETMRSETDEEFLAEFHQRVSNDGSIKYKEIVVNTVAETVEAIWGFGRCNLFVIGRMLEGQIMAALNNRSECPKLGTVGNLLISPEIKTTASVWVMQQYRSQLTGNSLASLKESEEELNSP